VTLLLPEVGMLRALRALGANNTPAITSKETMPATAGRSGLNALNCFMLFLVALLPFYADLKTVCRSHPSINKWEDYKFPRSPQRRLNER
jgi:hypothetical protein